MNIQRLFGYHYRIVMYLSWHSFWIGLRWNAKRQWLYIQLVPFLGVIVKFKYHYRTFNSKN